MTISIQFGENTVRVAVEIDGKIESAMTYLPKREWVGLTPMEVIEIELASGNYPRVFAAEIEAKLKEKNNG